MIEKLIKKSSQNKKTTIVIILILLFISILIGCSKLSNNLSDLTKSILDCNTYAYVDGVRVSTIPLKTDSYVIDTSHGNGTGIECTNNATASWDNNNWAITISNATVSGTRCNIYFKTVGNISLDCDNNPIRSTVPSTLQGLARTIAEQAFLDNSKSEFVSSCNGVDFSDISSDTNGKGVYEIASTKNDTYPIYYYRGAVTNNNVLFANFCWKAVRTTDTGGVKLIYNGTPTDGKCTNTTGTSTQIGTSKFNPLSGSPAYAGYMYGTIYSNHLKKITTSKTVINSMPITTSHYFGTSYDYGTTNSSKYTLGGTITLGSDHADYSELVGQYTLSGLDSTQATSTTGTYSSLRYIVAVEDSTLYYITMLGGQNESFYNDIYYFYDDVSKTNETQITTFNWVSNYSNVTSGMYACGKTQNCTSPIYITTSTKTDYTTLTDNGYIYGNGVTYDSTTGTYTLTDTIEITPSNYSTATNFNNYHYTCRTASNTCTTLYYVYYINNLDHYYIKITGVDPGTQELIDVVMENMFSNDTDSTAKTNIDNWYSNNMTSYTNKLEDTIFCNDRSIDTTNETNGLGGWNPEGGSMIDSKLYFSGLNRVINHSPKLECSRDVDKFTVSPTIGNGKLTYPVGLLTIDEVMYAGSVRGLDNTTFYLYTNQDWLSGTPYIYETPFTYEADITSNGKTNGILVSSSSSGLRPSVSLAPTSTITQGDGTATNPYVVE